MYEKDSAKKFRLEKRQTRLVTAKLKNKPPFFMYWVDVPKKKNRINFLKGALRDLHQ